MHIVQFQGDFHHGYIYFLTDTGNIYTSQINYDINGEPEIGDSFEPQVYSSDLDRQFGEAVEA